MLGKRLVECGGYIAGRAGVGAEVGCSDVAGDVVAEVSAAGGGQRRVGTDVDILTCLELNLRAVVDAGDATEGPHQIHVLCPCLLAADVADVLAEVGRIVVGVNIGDVPCGVVERVVFTLCDIKRLVGVLKVPVHGEVDHAGAVPLGVVGGMVVDAVEEGVGAGFGDISVLILTVVIHRKLDVRAVMRGIRERRGAEIVHPLAVRLLPGVEEAGVGLTALVDIFAPSCADLAEDVEIRVLTAGEVREVSAVERPAVDVLFGVETEGVNTHIHILGVGFVDIVRYRLVLGVDVAAVALNGGILFKGLTPAAGGFAVIILLGVMTVVLQILQNIQTRLELRSAAQACVIRVRLCKLAVGNQLHAVGRRQILNLCILLCRHRAEKSVAPVAGVIPDNVLDNLHILGVRRVNQVLIGSALTLIADVNSGHVHRMIAVVVIAAAVGNNRRNPDSGKAQCLEVVELVNQALEVAAPCRVGGRVVGGAVVPAVNVVAAVAVIKARGHNKINGILTP